MMRAAARSACPSAALLLSACAAPVPAASGAAGLLALEGVRAPADPAYLDLLAQARRDGVGITRERMIALRRAWMHCSDFNPVMPTILARSSWARQDA